MRHPHLTPPLVAIAHGSRDPRAGATVTELLAVARERAPARGVAGLDARAAFLGHAPPAAMQVLTALAGETEFAGRAGLAGGAGGERDVVVLPLLLTNAYHSGTDIPGLLDEAQATLPALRIRYGAPLGPHPGLLRALERRLAEAGLDPVGEAGRTAVVLASAGSSNPAANAVIARMAADWQAARGWQAVLPAYASAASPAPEEAVAHLLRGGARRVVVASYLLATGLFADRIRARSLAAGAAAVSAPLGAALEVADVLLARYLEAAASGRARASGQPAGHRHRRQVSAR
ncbi:MAG TPA: sirohydrochlorin chelatase [Streptosporangiaceae bacterium]|nr:sirohydrochlorin chelatase [Streptosporangiaceae bacterium]